MLSVLVRIGTGELPSVHRVLSKLAKSVQEFLTVGCAPAGKRTPTGRLRRRVTRLADSAQNGGRTQRGIELLVEEADVVTDALVEECDEARPERGGGGGSAQDHGLPIDFDFIAGPRAGIGHHVGDGAPRETLVGLGVPDVSLPRRNLEDRADASARCTTRAVIPRGFGLNRVSGSTKMGAPH